MLAALIVIGVIGTLASLLWGTYTIAKRNMDHEPSKTNGAVMGFTLWGIVILVALVWTPAILYSGYFRDWMFVADLFGAMFIVFPFASDKSETARRYIHMVQRTFHRST